MTMTFYRPLYDPLLCILVLCAVSKAIFADDCLRGYFCLPPATEKGIRYYPGKKRYEMGNTIKYTCDNTADYIFGNYVMKCGRNGTWNGEIPACARREEISEINHDNADVKHYFPHDIIDHACYHSGRTSSFNVITKNETFGTVVVKVDFRVSSVQDISIEKMLSVHVPGEGENCTLYEKYNKTNQTKTGKPVFSYDFKCEIKKNTRLFQIRRISNWYAVSLCDINIYTRPSYVHVPVTENDPSRNSYPAMNEANVEIYVAGVHKNALKNFFIKTQCASDFQICNGGLNYTKHTTEIPHGENVSVYCREGYRLEGDDHLQCKYGRFIYNTEPKCFCVVCRSSPPSITNGNWAEWDTFKEFFYGSRLTVICHSGYEFAGKMNFTECQADGSWSRANATCLKKDTATSLGLILIITGSVIGLVVLVILVLLLVFFLRKKNSEKLEGESSEGIYSEPFYSTVTNVSVPEEFSPPLPPLTTLPFYSDPKDMNYCIDDEGDYHEPYDSIKREKITVPQNRTTNHPEDFFIEKENMLYEQVTTK